MTALNTVYLNGGNAIRMEEKDLAGSVIASFDAYVAAYIYGASDILSLFYLDAISEVQITDDAETAVLGNGFIGLVRPAGVNYDRHASARLFKGALPLDDDAGHPINDYVALNDGGLNTLGDVGTPVVLAAGKQAGNLILSNQLFKSAYHVGTSSYGVKYRVNNSNFWISRTVGERIAQNNQLLQNFTVYTASDYKKGDSVEVTCWIENDEGTFESGIASFIALARTAQFGFSSAYASYAVANLGTPNTVYVTIWPPQTSYIDGINICQFFKDEACTINADTGFYTNGSRWWFVDIDAQGYYKIVKLEGAASSGNYPQGDPGNPAAYSITTWDSFSSTTSTICDYTQKPHQYSSGAWKTYKRVSDGKHYTDGSFASYCQDGYYRKQTGTQVWGWIQIYQGTEQGTTYTNCP